MCELNVPDVNFTTLISKGTRNLMDASANSKQMHPGQAESDQASGAQCSVLWRTVCLCNSTVSGLESLLGGKK